VQRGVFSSVCLEFVAVFLQGGYAMETMTVQTCRTNATAKQVTSSVLLQDHRGTARRAVTVEILSTAAQLYEKSNLTNIAISERP